MRLTINPGGSRRRPLGGRSLAAATLLALASAGQSGLWLARVLEMAGRLPPAGFVRFRTQLLAAPALLLGAGLLLAVAVLLARQGAQQSATRFAWGGAGLAAAVGGVSLMASKPAALLSMACALGVALLLDPRLPWRRIARLGRDALAFGASATLLAPLLWILSTSLRGPGLPQPTRLELWPAGASLANYARLAELLPLGRYLGNSLLVATVGVLASLLVASAAAFALVHLPTVWRRPILALSLLGLAVPPLALWLTRYLLFRLSGVLNTPLALLYPALLGGSPLCVLLLYGAFRRLPGELWDQARVDGAGPARLWWQIGLPQVHGMLVALAALVFGLFWGNFSDPLLYLSDPTWQTLPVGLQSLQQLTRADWPVLLAGATIATAPALAVFVAAQRSLLGGARP